MALRPSHLVARWLWLAPGLLLLLTLFLVKAAYDLRETLQHGTPAVAEVLEVFKTERADVTHGYVRLRVPLDHERVVERELPLPLSLMPQVEDRETVDVLVWPGAAQDVVVAAVARPQWRMAAINAAMSFVGMLLIGFGVFAWNRHLKAEAAVQVAK